MRGEVRPGRREGVGWQQRNRHARGWPTTQGLGGQGTRGAHFEHVTRVCDAGRVEAQRLVERHRMLPGRNEKRAYDAGRGAGRTGGGRGRGVAAAQVARRAGTD